jgi:hypothetical protein
VSVVLKPLAVKAMLCGDWNDGAWSQWTPLTVRDFRQIEWECGRMVVNFLKAARDAGRPMKFVLSVDTNPEP